MNNLSDQISSPPQTSIIHQQSFQHKLPRHIAIVMDGNGRWAARRNLPRVAGHQAGAKAIRKIVEACIKDRIEVLTLFAFSSENWNRPVEEVNFLMSLFLKTLKQQTPKLHENNIQLRIVGDHSRFDQKLQYQIMQSEKLTASNSGLKLVIAANYSGRWDIVEATRKFAKLVEAKKFKSTDLTAELFQQCLSLADLPEPDLLIRTSGEQRISNFMLWQFAYTEFYFTDILWPDFDATAFQHALSVYASRQRRFGLTSAQIDHEQLAHI